MLYAIYISYICNMLYNSYCNEYNQYNFSCFLFWTLGRMLVFGLLYILDLYFMDFSFKPGRFGIFLSVFSALLEKIIWFSL